jgi:hypothetical protein
MNPVAATGTNSKTASNLMNVATISAIPIGKIRRFDNCSDLINSAKSHNVAASAKVSVKKNLGQAKCNGESASTNPTTKLALQMLCSDK